MTARQWTGLALVAALCVSPACSDETPSGTAAEQLTEALTNARPGQTVRIGVGSVTGSFVVPAGVTLEGSTDGESYIIAPAGQPAVELVPGTETEPTTLRNLIVVADGGYGISAAGPGGHVTLEDVQTMVQAGIGVGFQDLDRLTMVRVAAQGPISVENPNGPLEPDPTLHPTHGIVLINVADAQLEDVTSDGFAAFGALLINSNTTWNGGGAEENMGTGIMAQGGTQDFSSLSLCRQLQGVRLLPAFGAVFAGQADVQSSGLDTCETEGVGLFHENATGRHVDLSATDNEDVAIWLQRSTSFELAGSSTALERNALAGLVAVDSSGVNIADGQINSTALAPRVLAEAGLIMVGDGAQLVGTTTDVTFSNVRFSQNERVGVLLDLAGTSTAGISLDQVEVEGINSQLGVITQNGTAEAGWDTGVTRLGATQLNDADFTGSLSVVEIVSPTDFPNVDDVATNGLDVFGIVSPTD